jgi:ParB-like chromosome segregation protein Spo0J
MDIREVPLHDLILDPRLNLRDRLDQDTVERYAEAWNRLPPVTIYKIGNKLYLADGIHRHAAAVLLGKRTIKAEVVSGSFEDALDYVAGANLFHGLPLSRSERRRAIEVKLRLHHERSDRRLAEELAVGRELVAKIRRQLVESGQLEAGETRLGADGKTYPAAPPAREPQERLPKGRGKAQEEEDLPKGRKGRRDEEGVPEGPPRATPPWQAAEAKTVALSPPTPSAAPTINEMLGMMTQRVMEVVTWTQADGFIESYKTAGANARGLFQTAVIKLAARADQLRRA